MYNFIFPSMPQISTYGDQHTPRILLKSFWSPLPAAQQSIKVVYLYLQLQKQEWGKVSV